MTEAGVNMDRLKSYIENVFATKFYCPECSTITAHRYWWKKLIVTTNDCVLIDGGGFYCRRHASFLRHPPGFTIPSGTLSFEGRSMTIKNTTFDTDIRNIDHADMYEEARQ